MFKLFVPLCVGVLLAVEVVIIILVFLNFTPNFRGYLYHHSKSRKIDSDRNKADTEFR